MLILLADFVERADDPALHDGPKPFDCVGVNRAADIFTGSVMHHAMRDCLVEMPIALMIIRRKQARFVREGFVDKEVEDGGIRAFD